MQDVPKCPMPVPPGTSREQEPSAEEVVETVGRLIGALIEEPSVARQGEGHAVVPGPLGDLTDAAAGGDKGASARGRRALVGVCTRSSKPARALLADERVAYLSPGKTRN
jgi:hypothetical protein